MSNIVMCCNTLEDELKLAYNTLGIDYPVIWLEAGLHNTPEVLRAKINEELKKLSGIERVLMVLGHCGGATVGIESGDFEVIMPKADDCLSILLGSMKRRLDTSREAATYFLTDGWMRYTNNLLADFEKDSVKFGRAKAIRIYKLMLKHYKRFGFIDTKTYDIEKAKCRAKDLSENLEINMDTLPGDDSWLHRLLKGPWSEQEFLILPPNMVLDSEMWIWITEVSSSQLT